MKYWIKPLGARDMNAKEVEAPPNQWVDAVQMAFPGESVFCQVTKEEVIEDIKNYLQGVIRDKCYGLRLVDDHYPPVVGVVRPKDIKEEIEKITSIDFEIGIQNNRIILSEK